jgi:hypothetical protein
MQQVGLLVVSFLMETLIYVFFCISLVRAIHQVKPQNRTIEPSSIWLFLIPVFNLFWIFVIISKMASSIKNELEDRDYEVEENPGYNIGLLVAVIPFLTYVFYLIDLFLIKNQVITIIIGTLGIMRLIFFIQYWMKISWYRRVLETNATEEDATSEE